VTMTPANLREKIAESKKPKPRKTKWEAPTVDDLAYGQVLCFDQTLTNTGVALVINDEQCLRALNCTNLVQKPTAKGHEGSIQKGMMLRQAFEDVRGTIFFQSDEIVYEQPPVMGYRIESSLMAAFALRLVWPQAEGIYNQHAKAIFLGPGSKEKSDVKAAMNSLIPNFNRTGAWNEHVRDAVMLGLTYLHDVKREGSDSV